MLNFPKIKKVLKDEERLWRYLTEDEGLANRNYELDHERRMLRKKSSEEKKLNKDDEHSNVN